MPRFGALDGRTARQAAIAHALNGGDGGGGDHDRHIDGWRLCAICALGSPAPARPEGPNRRTPAKGHPRGSLAHL